MGERYRGHEIILTSGGPLCAIILDGTTGEALPTKVVAMPGEPKSVCRRRARELVDLYVRALAAGCATVS